LSPAEIASTSDEYGILAVDERFGQLLSPLIHEQFDPIRRATTAVPETDCFQHFSLEGFVKASTAAACGRSS
jgi:hypothetical protein